MTEQVTIEEAAKALDQSEYREEGSSELWARMKAAGLVAVFGAGDDLMEFEGAIRDEVGCWEGGEAKITPTGLLDPDDDLYNRAEKAAFPIIKAVWDSEGYSWVYETDIPHVTFDVLEDGEKYCRGIVFDLSALK